jgi:hypothetical protein
VVIGHYSGRGGPGRPSSNSRCRPMASARRLCWRRSRPGRGTHRRGAIRVRCETALHFLGIRPELPVSFRETLGHYVDRLAASCRFPEVRRGSGRRTMPFGTLLRRRTHLPAPSARCQNSVQIRGARTHRLTLLYNFRTSLLRPAKGLGQFTWF